MAKPYKVPNTPPLPLTRVDAERPYSHIGVDYFGPMYAKTGNKGPGNKVWGALFVCMVTRAVHLELVTDCTAEGFLKAFGRFIGRRGVPVVVISDNGTNFKLASKLLG